MTNLYDMANETMKTVIELSERAENGEPVSNDEFMQALQLSQDTEQKIVNTGFVVKNLSSDSEQISEEIKRLQAKKKAIDNRTEWLKSNIKFAMQTLGIEKVKHPVLPISLRSSPQFSVNVENAENLPSEYQVVKIEPNKKALLDLFKDNPSFALNGVTFTKGQFLKIG